MDVGAVLASFGLIFVAELGDKTQLAAMALATRHPWKTIFFGMALAFALLNLLAVTVGGVLFSLIPLLWIQLGAAALFAYFGVSALRTGTESGADGNKDSRDSPFVAAFLMILTAEMGDKTQLATAGLAAQNGAPVEVFAGSSLALWSASLLGILLGKQIVRYVSARNVQRAAAVMFLAFAATTLWQALFGNPPG